MCAAHLFALNFITHMYSANNRNYEVGPKCCPQCPACKEFQSLFSVCEIKFHTHTTLQVKL
jgi:hypothetical protein